MRLPRSIHFPFGYTVRVVLVSDAEMLDAMDQDERDKDELADGLWDCGDRIIRIRQSLTMKRKRYVLTHETQHAVIDWQHHCLNEGIAGT